jgi:hypothetical protein
MVRVLRSILSQLPNNPFAYRGRPEHQVELDNATPITTAA